MFNQQLLIDKFSQNPFYCRRWIAKFCTYMT